MKKTTTKKTTRVPKTRNHGFFTESQYWGFIRSALRQKSRWWKPILHCKLNARRPCKKGRQKWEYQCNCCKQWFSEKEVNVDHIRPAGSLQCAADLAKFVETLFCEIDNLQILCTNCHDIKSMKDKLKSRTD